MGRSVGPGLGHLAGGRSAVLPDGSSIAVPPAVARVFDRMDRLDKMDRVEPLLAARLPKIGVPLRLQPLLSGAQVPGPVPYIDKGRAAQDVYTHSQSSAGSRPRHRRAVFEGTSPEKLLKQCIHDSVASPVPPVPIREPLARPPSPRSFRAPIAPPSAVLPGPPSGSPAAQPVPSAPSPRESPRTVPTAAALAISVYSAPVVPGILRSSRRIRRRRQAHEPSLQIECSITTPACESEDRSAANPHEVHRVPSAPSARLPQSAPKHSSSLLRRKRQDCHAPQRLNLEVEVATEIVMECFDDAVYEVGTPCAMSATGSPITTPRQSQANFRGQDAEVPQGLVNCLADDMVHSIVEYGFSEFGLRYEPPNGGEEVQNAEDSL